MRSNHRVFFVRLHFFGICKGFKNWKVNSENLFFLPTGTRFVQFDVCKPLITIDNAVMEVTGGNLGNEPDIGQGWSPTKLGDIACKGTFPDGYLSG